jgi:hypothetical protein
VEAQLVSIAVAVSPGWGAPNSFGYAARGMDSRAPVRLTLDRFQRASDIDFWAFDIDFWAFDIDFWAFDIDF